MHFISLHFFFLSLLKSCFSTSVFRTMHFLFNMSQIEKHTLPLSVLPREYGLHTALHCSCAYSVVYTEQQIKSKYLLPFLISNVNVNYKKSPEGTSESPPLPEVRVSRSVTGRRPSLSMRRYCFPMSLGNVLSRDPRRTG